MKKLLQIAAMLAACLATVGCSKKEEVLSPNTVIIDEKKYSLLLSTSRLKKELGERMDNKSPECVLYVGADVKNSNGFYVRDFTPVSDSTKRHELVLYNGVTTATTEEELEQILGSSYIWSDSETRADYFEFFINNEEISYDELKKEINTEDYFSTAYAILDAGRKYCENELAEAETGYYIIIHYTCYDNAENDFSVEIARK